jgi:hypothetical protein
MTLRFNLLGYEIANIELDFGEDNSFREITPLDKGIKKMSGFWVRRMNK